MSKRVYTKTELGDRFAKVGKIENKADALDLYTRAAAKGMSVSAYMELLDPSEPDDSLDAFQRAMALSGIRTTANPDRGVFSDKVERFYASDQPASIVLFPEFINREMRQARLAQDITSEIIAVRTPVDSDVYRSIYVDTTDLDVFRMKRVAERTEVPKAKIKTQENSISLYKYGLALEATYEAVRRMRIDQLRVHLNLVAMQNNIDKGTTALDVAINGDGNNNAATTFTAVSLDSAATTGITYKAWIKFLMKFYPYQCTTIVGNQDALLQILTMQFPSVDPLMLLAQYATSNSAMQVKMPNGVFTSIQLVLAPTAPANVLVGLDKNFALEEVTEIGGTLTETDKIINQQFTEIVLTEVVGFSQMYNQAIKVLTYA